YLQSEYELTFSEAVALNYPAVTSETRDEVSKQLTELKYKLRGLFAIFLRKTRGGNGEGDCAFVRV
ncbi:MAG: hypothetical protein IJF68_00045, partial [Opitutales bacterium]|nr:hypothetical protein [Opitutales bacterium]